MLDRFVAYNARYSGEAGAFASLSRQQSYARLEATVSRLARALEGLVSLGLRRVAVQCPDTWRHWALVLALGRLGLASASLSNGDVPGEELAALAPDLVILHGPGGLPATGERLLLDESWFGKVLDGVEADGPASFYPPVPVDPGAPCRAALASGTGRETCVLELSFAEVEAQLHRLIYHDVMEFFARNAGRRARMPGKPELLCSIGPQSLSGFLMAGAALASGTTLRSSDSHNIGVEVMQAPALMIVMTPGHLDHLLRALPPGGTPASHVYLTVVGGPLSSGTLERTASRFTRHVQVVYGTDECGIVAAIAAERRQADDEVGPPLPWVEVDIVDEAGYSLPHGQEGEIRIRGCGVARGYAGGDPAGERRFRNGWFHPGDRGVLSPEGALSLRGRVDGMVNVGGAKIDLGVVEAILRTEPRIRDAGMFVMADQQGVEQFYAALVSHEEFDAKALSARLRQRYAALPPVTMIWVPEIPRSHEGHVDRARLHASLRDYVRQELEPRQR